MVKVGIDGVYEFHTPGTLKGEVIVGKKVSDALLDLLKGSQSVQKFEGIVVDSAIPGRELPIEGIINVHPQGNQIQAIKRGKDGDSADILYLLNQQPGLVGIWGEYRGQWLALESILKGVSIEDVLLAMYGMNHHRFGYFLEGNAYMNFNEK